MNDTLSSAVTRLLSSSSRLNDLTNSAAETIRSVEDFLNRVCSVGISAEVTIDSWDTGAGPTAFEALVYKRVGKRFRIGVMQGYDDDPESWSITAWSDCSREMKLKSLPMLPDLVTEVANASSKKVVEAEVATQTVADLLEALQKEEG